MTLSHQESERIMGVLKKSIVGHFDVPQAMQHSLDNRADMQICIAVWEAGVPSNGKASLVSPFGARVVDATVTKAS